jgi:hypothetical protein
MGSCVSKKDARGAGAGREGKVAAPLPPVKEISALSPVAEEEEVKEVVLSEPPKLPPVNKKRQEQVSKEEVGSGRESASVGSAAKKSGVDEQEVVKREVVDAPEKARKTVAASPEESKPKQGGNGRARSPSPWSAHRRPTAGQQQPPEAPPNSRQPAVVSAFGCRSGRFSPSAARRTAERAVRRTHSAREADMAPPAKRALVLSRRDLGERSESPTASKRPSPSPSPVHRQAKACASRRAAAPERSRPRRVGTPERSGDDEQQQAAFAGEQKKPGELGQNPSVAMECFIFL